MEWETAERPGYFGKKRDELYSEWDRRFGKNEWRLVWQFGDLLLAKREAIQIYEDGYCEALKRNKQLLEWIVKTASDVYDTAPTNVEAKFDYEKQETPNNHIHDVTIRRALMRLGVWFKGDHLVHVRGENTEGEKISPHFIPFHRPELILPVGTNQNVKDYGNKGFWWRELGIPLSVEEFYQHNKLLQVRME